MSPHFLRFAARSLGRNPRRTALTVGGLALFLAFFTVLLTVITALDRTFEENSKDPLLVVAHRTGMLHDLHESAGPKIARVAGVKEAREVVFFGGVYGEHTASNTFAAVAVADYDLREFWHGEAELSGEDQDAFRATRAGALVGPETMKKFGWHRGQQVTLLGTARPVELTFTIVGTFALRTDHATFLFHRSYLEGSVDEGERGAVTFFWVRVASAADMPRVAREIDAMFAESDTPTRTIPLRQFFENSLAVVGNVRAMVSGVATLALIAMVLLVANSIAMSVRERAGEMAVMRALGFGRRHAVGLVLLECALVGIAGGVLGCALVWGAFAGGFSLGFGFVSGFRVEPATAAMAVLVATSLCCIAGVAPAVRIASLPITSALRSVD